MELEQEGSITFLSTVIKRSGNSFTTKVYRKTTDTGLLLHFLNHIDNKYKRNLVNTVMVDCTYHLSPTKEAFLTECVKLCTMFSIRLHYPKETVNSAINKFSQGHKKKNKT